jgi:hypothetical protein
LHLDTDLILVFFTIINPAYRTHLKHSSTCKMNPPAILQQYFLLLQD